MVNKSKKKRNKKYSGSDAKLSKPVVVRVAAEERSAFKEWWLTYRQIVRFISAAIGILVAIALAVIGIIGLF